MSNRLRFQANPQTNNGVPGFMVTAWSDHVDPPQSVLAEWLTTEEAAAFGAKLNPMAIQYTPAMGANAAGCAPGVPIGPGGFTTGVFNTNPGDSGGPK